MQEDVCFLHCVIYLYSLISIRRVFLLKKRVASLHHKETQCNFLSYLTQLKHLLTKES